MHPIDILLESLDLDKLKLNLSKSNSLGNQYSTFSLLQYAVKFNKIEIVKILIDLEVNPNQVTFNDNSYPLIESICENNKEITDILINCKNINVNVYNDLLESPLFYACLNNDYKLVKLLIEKGANVNHVNGSGESILSITLDLNIVKLLLISGANPNLENNYDYSTPLIEAVRESNFNKIKLMVEHGAEIDHETTNSETAISVAYNLKNEELLKFLNDKLEVQYF